MVLRKALHPLSDCCGRDLSFEAPQADAIVEFISCRHPSTGLARLSEWHDPDRFLAGLELFRDGKVLRLLFSWGVSPCIRPTSAPLSRNRITRRARGGHGESAFCFQLRLLPSASYFRWPISVAFGHMPLHAPLQTPS